MDNNSEVELSNLIGGKEIAIDAATLEEDEENLDDDDDDDDENDMDGDDDDDPSVDDTPTTPNIPAAAQTGEHREHSYYGRTVILFLISFVNGLCVVLVLAGVFHQSTIRKKNDIGDIVVLHTTQGSQQQQFTNYSHSQQQTKRWKMLNASNMFSFVHISKCAGATWISTLKHLPLDVCPTKKAGKEYSVFYQTNNKCKAKPSKKTYHLVSLRSPRHHVWSLFTECKYDKWGIKTTNNTGFPRSGNNTATDESDFQLWLDHFLPMSSNTQDMYSCYHPANYQSRHLTQTKSNVHGVKGLPASNKFEPNLTIAINTYWQQDFVPLVEFFHESKCILYFRLGTNAPHQAQSYLEDTCHCPQPVPSNNETQTDEHVTHHTLGHRSSLHNLPQQSLTMIANLTVIDSVVYTFALGQFMQEIAWLEYTLGRSVLCGDVLEKLEPELEYLDLSVTLLYTDAIKRMRRHIYINYYLLS